MRVQDSSGNSVLILNISASLIDVSDIVDGVEDGQYLVGTNAAELIEGDASDDTIEADGARTRSMAVMVRISCWVARRQT